MTSGYAPGQTEADHQARLLRQALAQTRASLAIAALMLLAFIAFVLYTALTLPTRLKKKEDEIRARTEQRLKKDLPPVVKEQGENLLRDVVPPVASAFYKEFKAEMPAYVHAVDRQGKKLQDHLRATIKQDVEEQYRASLAEYRKVLAEEFPEVTDKAKLDRMMRRLQSAFDHLVRRYYLDEFEKVLARTVQLWKQVPPAPDPKGGTRALVDELGNDLADWLRVKMVEGAAPEGRP